MNLSRVLASVVLWAGLCGAASAFDRKDEGIDCAHPTTTMESDLCASDVAAAADAELNAVYAQARRQLRTPANGGTCSYCGNAEQELVLAQRAWMQLRDHDCQAVYALNSDGTARNGAQMRCLITLARDRTRQLRDFYELL
ncbi:lysozyme inhibitor LprI family protein [Stenotrophomonas sp. C1657]|uniref:lysozyme inhibitor LprI family protein n=1 Tax=Stenotrophomonas sp. C1657 TaxID=3077844 RepID=UPI00293C566A|nr:lysozyme inhibitor LprI family protein [Stenotrophomonas sp. C1657]MDV3515537.1 lysozyme inhibitor LprI family protein [Stenotrophomonas sp. C1657]